MQGEIVPFIAGCLFLAFGVLAVQGVVGTLWRSRRFRGRADGKLVALEALDGRKYAKAADVPTGPNAPLSFRQVVDFSIGGTTYQARGPFLMREVTKTFSHAGGQGTVTQTFIGLMCVVVGLLIFFFNGNLAWIGPDWHR